MIKIKRCSKCKKEKGTSHFNKNKATKDGLQHQCRPCSKKQIKASNEKHKDKPCGTCGKGKRVENQTSCKTCHLERVLSGKYGIPVEEVRRLRRIDNCDACGRSTEEAGTERSFHIDHCHDKGHVRGVLCHYCNIALGMMRDDPVRIRKLEMYINRATYDEQNTTEAS